MDGLGTKIMDLMRELGEGLDIPDDEFFGLTDEEIIRIQHLRYKASLEKRFMASLPEVTRRAVMNINLEDERYSVTALRSKWSGKTGHSYACVLNGSPGTGKTVAACWAAKKMIAIYGQPATYIHVPTYSNLVGCGAENHRTWDQVRVIEDAAQDDGRIIVLDDLGRERDSQAVICRVGYMIDCMWRRMAMAVITTNLDIEQMYLRYGDYIGSRLLDVNWSTMVACVGGDNRLAGSR